MVSTRRTSDDDRAIQRHRRQIQDAFKALMAARGDLSFPPSQRVVSIVTRAQACQKACEERVLARIETYQWHTRELVNALSRRHCVYRLPPEILGNIFNDAIKDAKRFFILNICRVSSQWRSVAVSTPALWTSVSFRVDAQSIEKDTKAILAPGTRPEFDVQLIGGDRPSATAHARSATTLAFLTQPEHVVTWSSRAGRLPLKLTIQWYPSRDGTFPQAWVDTFVSLRKRIGSLEFLIPLHEPVFSALFFSAQNVAQPFPELRRLEVSASSLSPRFAGREIALDAPNLQHVTFRQCYTCDSPPLQWYLLTNVSEITLNEPAFWGFLVQADKQRPSGILGQLASLTVDFKRYPMVPSSIRASLGKPVSFPSVTSFTIRGVYTNSPPASLKAIQLPTLQLFRCQCLDNPPHRMRRYMDAVLCGSHSPRSSLTCLVLDRVSLPTPAAAAHVFRAVPKLVTLRLRNLDATNLLGVLSTDRSPPQTTTGDGVGRKVPPKSLLPKLRHLKLWCTKGANVLEPLFRYRGLVTHPDTYPPQADKRCLPLRSVWVDSARQPLARQSS